MRNKQHEWMKVPEAAAYFRVPRTRMYELIQRGELPAVRIGERSIRVNRREMEKFLWENCSMGPHRGPRGGLLGSLEQGFDTISKG